MYVTGTQMAEVEVDTKSGAVRVLRVVAAHDVGRPVFVEGVVGQIEGGIAMGLGFALTEEFVPGETRGFKQYRIPRTRDMPEMVTILVGGSGEPPELQVKGVAECSNMVVAPGHRERHRPCDGAPGSRSSCTTPGPRLIRLVGASAGSQPGHDLARMEKMVPRRAPSQARRVKMLYARVAGGEDDQSECPNKRESDPDGAPVAQWIEHLTSDQMVGGSNPLRARQFRSTSSLTRSAQRRRVCSREWAQRLIIPAPWARP